MKRNATAKLVANAVSIPGLLDKWPAHNANAITVGDNVFVHTSVKNFHYPLGCHVIKVEVVDVSGSCVTGKLQNVIRLFEDSKPNARHRMFLPGHVVMFEMCNVASLANDTD